VKKIKSTLYLYQIIILCSIVFYSFTSCDYSSNVRIMSFNIRYDNPDDGINTWSNRTELVFKTLKEQDADLIGFQEVLHHQLEALRSNLQEYGWYGVGREDGEKGGEFCPVFYKKARFNQLDKGTYWLSEHPDSIGSIGWSAHLPRILTWTKLFDKIKNDTLFAFNTHFSHVSDEAREQSAKLVVSLVQKQSGSSAAVITGDFNFIRNAQAYRIMSTGFDDLTGLTDIGQKLDVYNQELTTINGFGRSRRNRVIDFIWTNKHLNARSYQIEEVKKGEIFISDHYPVVGDLSYTINN